MGKFILILAIRSLLLHRSASALIKATKPITLSILLDGSAVTLCISVHEKKLSDYQATADRALKGLGARCFLPAKGIFLAAFNTFTS